MPYAADLYYSISQGTQTPSAPIILLHGAGSNHTCWSRTLRRINHQLVMAPDLPGHGKSHGVACHSLANYSLAIRDFLAATGWYRAVFIGHSMGAAIALQFALDYPEHVAGVVSISGAASFNLEPDFIEMFQSQITTPLGLQRLREKLGLPENNCDWCQDFQHSLKNTRPSLWYADWRACSQFDIRSKIHTLKPSVLIAHGTNDLLTPYASAVYLSEQIPNAELVPFYQSGHLLLLEEPRILQDHVLRFLLKTRYL